MPLQFEPEGIEAIILLLWHSMKRNCGFVRWMSSKWFLDVSGFGLEVTSTILACHPLFV